MRWLGENLIVLDWPVYRQLGDFSFFLVELVLVTFLKLLKQFFISDLLYISNIHCNADDCTGDALYTGRANICQEHVYECEQICVWSRDFVT